MVSDEGHAAGRRLRDYGKFRDPSSEKNALLVECGQHWETASAEVSLQTALRFLKACDAVELDQLELHIMPAPETQTFDMTDEQDHFWEQDHYENEEFHAHEQALSDVEEDPFEFAIHNLKEALRIQRSANEEASGGRLAGAT